MKKIIPFIIIILISGVVYYSYFSDKQKNSGPTMMVKDKSVDKKAEEGGVENSNTDFPPKLKNIGVKLDYFDPKTQKAGDFWFTKQKQQFNSIFMDYGFFIPAGNVSVAKNNPQPTFLVPMGTEVTSMIDGVVFDVPKLYSNDYSVMVVAKEGSQWIVELEHVINPRVKKGDKVSAGQVVAEVSNFWEKNSGLGMVEIGMLFGGGKAPQHFCPFVYLDDSVKDDIFAKIKAFYAVWEKHTGNNSLYDEDAYATPGCLTLESVDG